MVHGPRDMQQLSLFQRIADRRFVMLGTGANYFHMTFIDGIIAGLMLCAQHPQADGSGRAPAIPHI